MASHDRYSMGTPFQGLLVIINNETFADPTLEKRNGTQKDAERLETTFKQLGFNIEKYNNQTCVNMLQLMGKVKDRSIDYDCVAVAILTHGIDDKIHGVGGKDDKYRIDTVLGPLKDTKKGIPKLVIIQACRGDDLDVGHVVEEDHDAAGSSAEDKVIRVPMEADFLYHFSTSPGYRSFRNSVRGSVFIQKLCDVFDEAKDEIDVVKSLIQVNRRVAEDYESYVPNPINPQHRVFHKKKQMPSFVCMLRKELFLKKQT